MAADSLDPVASPLFEAWTDPASGVTSHVLTTDASPRQQAFYFTNANVAANGRYLWFYASHPPSPRHVLGVVDAATDEVRVYPETAFDAEAPWIDPDTGTAYWAAERDVYRRDPAPDASAELVGHVSRNLVDGAAIEHVSTHLTRSADGRRLNLDVRTTTEFHVGTMTIDTGDVDLWHSSERCYKHSQFSPADPDLLMFCQDWWRDAATNAHTDFENRIWLQREGEAPRPLFETMTGTHAHEWWGADGRSVWYVDYESGTHRYDLATDTDELVWPGGTCHAHASADGRLVVGDVNTYSWADDRCHVTCYDAETGASVDVVTDLPQPPTTPNESANYHVHPHPQFVLDDGFVAYTTTVRGGVELALVPTAELLAHTR